MKILLSVRKSNSSADLTASKQIGRHRSSEGNSEISITTEGYLRRHPARQSITASNVQI